MRILTAHVVSSRELCRAHHRLTLRLPRFQPASPGQFIHLGPESGLEGPASTEHPNLQGNPTSWRQGCESPLLRRAFSIASLRELDHDVVELDVMYRVVGVATKWLERLRPGDPVSVLGPLGNRLTVPKPGRTSWLVAGGVGLPPLLWFAESLRLAGRSAVAFFGAQSTSLIPLTLDPHHPGSIDGSESVPCAVEFARLGINSVIATDDGSYGFHGTVVTALRSYQVARRADPQGVCIYTCGPERMMEAVAEFAREIGCPCLACMERSMACGTGTCQSCVVAVRDPADPQGWAYRLCCTDGPIFDTRLIQWRAVG